MSNVYAPSMMGGTDAARWARAFQEAIRKNPDLLDNEGFLSGWFGNAISAGHDTCRGKMERYNGQRNREMAGLGYYLSHHCMNTPLPDAAEIPAEIAEIIHADRGMLTFVREFMFKAARNDILYPQDEAGSDQASF